MKTTKRLLSMLLALIMVVSAAMPAFAASGDYTITITNSDAISSAGHKYYAYQIFDGTLDTTGIILTDITWGQNIDSANFLAALKADDTFGEDDANIFKSATTAAEVATIFATPANQTSAIIKAFAKNAKANLAGTAVGISSETNAPYSISIDKALAGYYLVVDTLDDPSAANKDISDFILQVVGNVSVEHKGSIPTMDKTVSETGETYGDAIATGIGDVHYYRIIAELPDDYNLYTQYYLEFQDTLSAGLTFGEIVAVKGVIRTSGTTVNITGYTLDVDDTKVDGTTDMSLIINDLKAKATLSSDDAVEIIYKASLNSNAVVDGNGISNTAKIIYSNDPNYNGKGQSTTDETNVYPLNLKIKKIDGKDTIVPLKDAKFVLSRDYTDGSDSHRDYAVVTDGKLSEWVHHYIGDNCKSTDANYAEHTAAVDAGKVGTILTTNAAGEIEVSGLDAAKFYLTEIAAPNGYNKILDDIDFSISITVDEENDKIATMKVNSTGAEGTFDVSTAEVTLTIKNFKGDVLPSTGGIGTTLFYVAGGAMVAFAALTLITKKRMNKE